MYFICNQKQRKSPENGDWKVFIVVDEAVMADTETKKVSWKWRLKGYSVLVCAYSTELPKQRKSPENGDWKVIILLASLMIAAKKQRKSPENGDWKEKFSCFGEAFGEVWNKESLLKMEIERGTPCQSLWAFRVVGNKESLLKMEIESKKGGTLLIESEGRNKESLLKMEIERCIMPNSSSFVPHTKQRKSPENGDWKCA